MYIEIFCLISFGDLVNSLEIGVLVQLLLVLAQFNVALVMGLSIREIRKGRRREFLEKRLEEFYIPLMKLFDHGTLSRGPETHRIVEEIIVSKRHLCGKKVANNSCISTPTSKKFATPPPIYKQTHYA